MTNAMADKVLRIVTDFIMLDAKDVSFRIDDGDSTITYRRTRHGSRMVEDRNISEAPCPNIALHGAHEWNDDDPVFGSVWHHCTGRYAGRIIKRCTSTVNHGPHYWGAEGNGTLHPFACGGFGE